MMSRKESCFMEYLATVYYRIEGKPNDLQDIYDQYRTLLNKKLFEEGKAKSVSYASMVYSLGVDTKEQYLRGNIIKCELVDNSLSIEAEDNCAVMAAQEISDYLKNGNITHSVNMPEYLEVEDGVKAICDEAFQGLDNLNDVKKRRG